MDRDDLQSLRLLLHESHDFLGLFERFEIQEQYVGRMGAQRAHQNRSPPGKNQYPVDGRLLRSALRPFQAKRQFNVRADDNAAKQIGLL